MIAGVKGWSLIEEIKMNEHDKYSGGQNSISVREG